VRAQDGVWHLWGHSCEIERYRMWKQLEEVLRYVSGRSDVRYLTNGQLVNELVI